MLKYILSILLVVLMCSTIFAGDLAYLSEYADTITICPSGCDYTTVQSAETGWDGDMSGTLGRLFLVSGDWSAVGSGGVLVVDGWTNTDSTHSIAFKCVGDARHAGSLSVVSYRLTGVHAVCQTNEPWTVINGFTIIDSATNGTATCMNFTNMGTPVNYLIANNYVYRTLADLASYECILPENVASGQQMFINNFFTGYKGAGTGVMRLFSNNSRVLFANNTVVNSTAAIYASGTDVAYDSLRVINNIFQGVDSVFMQMGASFNPISDYNSTDSSTFNEANYTPGANDKVSQTFTFEGGATNFNLSTSDTGAKDYGFDMSSHYALNYNEDWIANARTAPWSIGASEADGVVAAGASVTYIRNAYLKNLKVGN